MLRVLGEYRKEDCCSRKRKDHDDLQKNIVAPLSEQDTVRVSLPFVVGECKDLEEATTKEEICTAFRGHVTRVWTYGE